MPTSDDFERTVRETARKLREDFESKTPMVPSEIVWAYQDDDVQRSIARRLEDGGRIASVRSVLPDIVTGYRRVYIDFSFDSISGLHHDGILVQVDESNKVAELLDPFSLSEDKKRLIEEHEGTFLTNYSTPLLRSGRGDDELTSRYEEFVREEGVNVAFTRMRQLFGQSSGGAGGIFQNFASGTCVITTKRIPTMRPPGTPDPFPGTESPDAEEQEDDNAIF